LTPKVIGGLPALPLLYSVKACRWTFSTGSAADARFVSPVCRQCFVNTASRPRLCWFLNMCLVFLTFIFFVSSCQQSVENVVVSFSRVLSHHPVLQQNKCSNATMYISLWVTKQRRQIISNKCKLDMSRLQTGLPFPVNLKGKESRKQQHNWEHALLKHILWFNHNRTDILVYLMQISYFLHKYEDTVDDAASLDVAALREVKLDEFPKATGVVVVNSLGVTERFHDRTAESEHL